MKKLRNIKNTQVEIAQVLSTDKILQRLITIDSEDALTKEDFELKTFNELMADKYISFAPLENAIEKLERNTFIIITLTSYDEERRAAAFAEGSIYIGTDADHLLLQNNKLRLLEGAERIFIKLQDQKLSSAGTLSLSGMNQVIFSEFSFGYKIYWQITDQPTGESNL